MDAIIDTPTTDIVITDEAVVVEGCTDNSFGKEITKTLALSAASTAGMIAGAYVLGFAAQKVQQFKTKRASKKNESKVHVVTDLPETPKTEKKD